MKKILWISFETPSVKDSKAIESVLVWTSLHEKWNKDYVKLIKNRKWDLLWIFNKNSKKVIFMDTTTREHKIKIENLILK